MEGDVHAPTHRPHRAGARDLGFGGSQVHVGELGAQRQDQIRATHALLDLARAEGSDVNTHVQRMIHGEDTLGEKRRHHG